MAPPKPTRGLRLTRTSFLSFPLEVRQQVYHHWYISQKADKSISLLLSCKKVYEEAVEYFRLEELEVRLKLQKMPLFRSPKAFGKPSFFTGSLRSTACYIPPTLDKLQVMRLRKLAIRMHFPNHNETIWDGGRKRMDYHEFLPVLRRQVNDVVDILEKTDTLMTVRIILQRRDEAIYAGQEAIQVQQNDCDVKHMLGQVVEVAARKGINVYAEHDQYFDVSEPYSGIMNLKRHISSYEEPLVQRMNGEAKKLGVLQPDVSRKGQGNQGGACVGGEPAVIGCNEAPGSEAADQKSANDFMHPSIKANYTLVPECRVCYAVFATKHDLSKHLDRKPTHRVSFRRKAENTLCKTARAGGGSRCCPTCAKGYFSRGQLEAHMERTGHFRYGIVPRWKEDNGYFNRHWKRWFEKYGWC